MEPSGDAEEREAKEQLATVDGGWDERGGFQLATSGETVSHKSEKDGETSLRTYASSPAEWKGLSLNV